MGFLQSFVKSVEIRCCWGLERVGGLCFIGKELSFGKMKRFGGGWGQWPLSITDVHNPITCTLKQSWWETLRYINLTTVNHMGLGKALDAGSQSHCHCLQRKKKTKETNKQKKTSHLPLAPLILRLKRKEDLYFIYVFTLCVVYVYIFICIYRLCLVYIYILAATTTLIPTSHLRVLIRIEIAYFCLRWI